MNELKNYFSLDHNIKLYIPSTKEVDKKIDTSNYQKEALRIFSSLFGGATSYEAIGAWASEKHGLITEEVLIVESYATKKAIKKGLVITEEVLIVESYATKKAIKKGLARVIKLALKIKKELKQEAVSLEYNGKLYFI